MSPVDGWRQRHLLTPPHMMWRSRRGLVMSWRVGRPASGRRLSVWRSSEQKYLRYGENPHQHAALYVDVNSGLSDASMSAGAGEHVEMVMAMRRRRSQGACVEASHMLNSCTASPCRTTTTSMPMPRTAVLRHVHIDAACVAIIKHTNPCGIAIGADVADAHRKAHACDPVSASAGSSPRTAG